MRLPRLVTPFLLVALVAAPGTARAQPAPGAAAVAGGGTLANERRELAGELTRVNAEIDALKRDKRSLRDDYRLRARMADAEALARRLTELDARLGVQGRAAPAAPDPTNWPAAPEVKPFDDRGDLEAKADILTDQARRLTMQADTLETRTRAVRGRQELRRRTSQLERDPFSPLEQAKRRVATSGAHVSNDQGAGIPVRGTNTEGTMPPPPVGPSSAPGSSLGPTIVTDQATKSTTTGATSAPFASPLGSGTGTDAAGSVASQFRGILDATTLAEIRRLEVPGSGTGGLQAMERALSALRARAADLAANAATLRKKAKSAQ